MRKEVTNMICAGETLLACLATQNLSDEEFEAIKDLADKIEMVVFICHIHDSAPPAELTH